MPDVVEKSKPLLIASSNNSISGLLMHLCEIPRKKIAQLEIHNGPPPDIQHKFLMHQAPQQWIRGGHAREVQLWCLLRLPVQAMEKSGRE